MSPADLAGLFFLDTNIFVRSFDHNDRNVQGLALVNPFADSRIA